MKPDHVLGEVSMSERNIHPNIDFEPSRIGPIVELKSTGQWWRLSHPLQYQHVEQMSDRAILKGMHSLVVSQSSTDQAEPRNSSLLSFDRENDSPFVKSLKKLRQEILQNTDISEKYLCVRVIGQHVNPREREKFIVLIGLPDRDDSKGKWSDYDGPTPLNELDILERNQPSLHRCRKKNEKDVQEDIVYRILEAIQTKHEDLERADSVSNSMLATFSAPGRLSGGNGLGTYVRMIRNHTNWIIQIIVPSLDEPFEIQQRRHESDSQRLLFARAREREALIHEQVKSKLPKKIKKLQSRSKKIEEKRLSSVKRHQMKVAFACVDKKRKTDEEIQETKNMLDKKKEKLVTVAETAHQHLFLNQELASNLFKYQEELPSNGVGVITFVALYCDPIHSEDAIAIRESLLNRDHQKTPSGGGGEKRSESSIVRRLLQLHLPHRTKRGTRRRKAGKRTGPMVSLDHGPVPEARYPPRSSFAAQFLGMWCHIHLEIDKSAVDPARVIDAWHKVYEEHVMGHAAWMIQCLIRSTIARIERKKRAASKKDKEEMHAAIIVQKMIRSRLARKRVAELKREILEQKLNEKKQAQKEKALKMHALQQEKKRAAAAAAKKKTEAKLALAEAERQRRGY
jgi:hypothetical protein